MTAKKSLSQQDIKKLLANQPVQRVGWPLEKDLKLLAIAVANKDETVTFRDGRKFSIRYETSWPDAVFVKPIGNAFVPCGYFSITKLRGAIQL